VFNTDFFIYALGNIFNVFNLILIMFGVAAGILIGALPGLSATMGVALLLPLTFGLRPESGIPMLIGLYCGAMYGGSISAVLLHTPGTSAAAATCVDGYPMARKGQAGLAIGFSLVGSFIGGIFSAFLLLFLAPPLANVSLLFGPAEYFTMALLGLTLIASLSSGSWIKGLISGFLGILFSTVGLDVMSSVSRFTFGQMQLLDGMSLVVMLIGVFSVAQALVMIEEGMEEDAKADDQVEQELSISGRILPTWSEIVQYKNTIIRSCLIGSFVGMIPGTGGDIACWLAYNEARRKSDNPELFGTGIPEGVLAPETANNAVTGSALIPALALGIPGSSVTAVLLSGLIFHGIRTGPRFITEYGGLTYTIILSIFVANIVMLLLGMVSARAGMKIAKISVKILAPFIIVLSVIGSYSLGNSMFDVGLMFVFGLFGYLLQKFGFPVAPMVIGMILAQMGEYGLRQALMISRGNWLTFVQRPISLLFLVVCALSLASAVRQDIAKNGNTSPAQ
jgi:putative tricarboxylic transport membrane protein